ncbi:FAD-binding oxidoreductase [Streptomyces lincolnensis]|uniref:FAD-binding oxidoreductase n=1 Tax=Streptomyces lincolnensis TaxID=1915 RepID=UPI0037D88125
MLSASNGYQQLRREFRGPILLRGDDGYDDVRRIWNGMFDRRPALVARCLDAVDVSAALRHAQRHRLPVTVRGGGHNVAGTSLAEDAVLIDLSLMRHVIVDADRRIAVAEGGCLLRDLDEATTVHGLACPSGVVSHTGLGGLALGGGYGWLARKWGLTCDHIIGAEVVLADGAIVSVTESSEPDLLWALRGGGGYLGVVTRFTLALRPVSAVYLQQLMYPLEAAADAIAGYRKFAETQSDDLHAVAALKHSVDNGQSALFLTAAWLGEPEDGRPAVEPLAAAVPPARSIERVLPYLALQRLGDDSEPVGNRYFTKSCYLSQLSGEVAAHLATAARRNPSSRSSIDFEYLMGAISDPTADSAFPHREAPYMCTASAQWIDPAKDQENIDWARHTIDGLSAWHYGGAYANYIQDPTDPTAVYGVERYGRLAALKSRYDSSNILGGGRMIVPGS